MIFRVCWINENSLGISCFRYQFPNHVGWLWVSLIISVVPVILKIFQCLGGLQVFLEGLYFKMIFLFHLFVINWHGTLSFFVFWVFVFCGLFIIIFLFLGLHLWHMEVPRLEVYLELQLLAYTTSTAMPDPSHLCDLHRSSRQRRILNPLSEGRDQTRNLVVPNWILFYWTTTGTPWNTLLIHIFYFEIGGLDMKHSLFDF